MGLDITGVLNEPRVILELAWLALAVFASAVVRGFSGFGSSALLVSAGTLVLAPRVVVPLSLALEIIASLHMLAWVWRSVDWRSVGFLCAGMVFTAPLGIAALAYAPADLLRAIIALVILSVCIALWRGLRFRTSGFKATVASGAVSGFANGLGAVGGLPVVAFLLGAGISAPVMRAVLVVYLLIADLFAGALAGAFGIYDRQLLLLILCSLPILVLGVWLGHRLFLRTRADRFQRLTLLLLIALSFLTLLRALL